MSALLLARVLFAAIVVMQALDGWTTWQILRLHRGIEANPLVIWLMDHFGVYGGLWAAKLGEIIVACFWLYALQQWGWHVQALVAMAIIAAVYLAIIVNNYRVLYPGGKQ